MFDSNGLTTAQILSVFSEEISARGGQVTDTFHDGRRLFTRSVLAPIEEVRPGDRVQGGVALKASEESVCLYPYVFRQVCRNGAIAAETVGTRRVEGVHDDLETALQAIREGIASCCAKEVFLSNVRKMRTACEMQADIALMLLPALARLPNLGNPHVLAQIMERFFQDGDQSQFGLANAVTATARDTQDPELRWNLEEFGGGIAISVTPRKPVDGERAAARQLCRVG
jgi:hypothetical protein